MVVLQHLRRVRWAVRATLLLGVAASVVANVLHALDNPISQAIAAWPPLALLLTVELISRVPVHRRWLAAARLIATATIAGIAAWVSYWHMAGVAARYGETGASPYLLPLSVDGLIVVASICLVELGGRITSLERDGTDLPTTAAHPATHATAAHPATQAAAGRLATHATAAHPATQAAAGHPATHATAAHPATHATATDATVPDPVIPGLIPTPSMSPPGLDATGPAFATETTATAAAHGGGAGREAGGRASGSPLRRRALEEAAAALPRATGAEGTGFSPTVTRQARPPAATGRAVPAQRSSATVRAGATRVDGTVQTRTEKKERARRSPAETVALADRLKAERPTLTDAEIAAELGITTSRLRTVRRETQAGDHTLAA
ncbi:DUF2637 domain-containing protein [Paractinoplanes toevensis]|uniref:DUF2637 domain-containing protein n=1 Tax=Paractinoplanes toevensis TaxID=571911 RepID=A0A919T7K0_9ACTN|nr:hypothetical protein Ato02nite_022580 [Actinoplanes toevensis]